MSRSLPQLCCSFALVSRERSPSSAAATLSSGMPLLESSFLRNGEFLSGDLVTSLEPLPEMSGFARLPRRGNSRSFGCEAFELQCVASAALVLLQLRSRPSRTQPQLCCSCALVGTTSESSVLLGGKLWSCDLVTSLEPHQKHLRYNFVEESIRSRFASSLTLLEILVLLTTAEKLRSCPPSGSQLR